jgi:hypothetical protein
MFKFQFHRTFVAASIAISALATVAPASAGTAQTWNLSNDMRLDVAGTNPDNTWKYMAGPMASLNSQNTFTPLGVFSDPCGGLAGRRCWTPSVADYDLTIWVNDTTQGYEDAGMPMMHPGTQNAAVVRWTSPVAGKISVLGRFSDVDAACGDGIQWYIKRNNAILQQGTLDNIGTGDGRVFSFNTTVSVNQNLNFIVTAGSAQDVSCDSTQLDVLIAHQN